MEYVPIRFLDDLFLNRNLVPVLVGIRNARTWTQRAKEHLKNQFQLVVESSDEFHWRVERYSHFSREKLEFVPPAMYCTNIYVRTGALRRFIERSESAYEYIDSFAKTYKIYVSMESFRSWNDKLRSHMGRWTMNKFSVNCALEGDSREFLELMTRKGTISSAKFQNVKKGYFPLIVQLFRRHRSPFFTCQPLMNLLTFWVEHPELCRNKSCWTETSKIIKMKMIFLKKYRNMEYKHEECGQFDNLSKVITFKHPTSKHEMVWTFKSKFNKTKVSFS